MISGQKMTMLMNRFTYCPPLTSKTETRSPVLRELSESHLLQSETDLPAIDGGLSLLRGTSDVLLLFGEQWSACGGALSASILL